MVNPPAVSTVEATSGLRWLGDIMKLELHRQRALARAALAVCAASAIALGAATAAQATELVNNGNFNGGFSGWTIATTANGTGGVPAVVSFDITGSGAQNAAQFQVGEVVFTGAPEGVILSQSITSLAGLLTFSADIASLKSTGSVANSDGGTFSILLDGLSLDSHSFGVVDFGVTYRAGLGFSQVVGAGSHTLDLYITRNFLSASVTPFQYVSNISAIQADPGGVPEPATWALMLGGFGLAGVALRRRHAAVAA